MRFIWLKLITRASPLIRRKEWWPYIGVAAMLLLIAHLSLAWWLQVDTWLKAPAATEVRLELRQEVRAQEALVLLQNLQQKPYIQKVTYRTKAQLLAEAQQRNPAMSSLYTATDNPFEDTLVVTLTSRGAIDDFIGHLEKSYSDMQVLPTFLPDALAQQEQANLMLQTWQGIKTALWWLIAAAYLGLLFVTLIFMRVRITARREELTLSYLAGADPAVLMGSFWLDGVKLLGYGLVISLALLVAGALFQITLVPGLVFPSFTALFALWWVPVVTAVVAVLVMPFVVAWLILRSLDPQTIKA